MNFYEILGVPQGATQADIKKAYRNLVKQHHPDTGGSEERFKEISTAYETLSDSQKRQEYDFKQSMGGSNPWSDFFNTHNGDFANMFNNAFHQQAKGPDITIRVRLTMEEVYYGTTKYIDTGHNQFNIKVPKGINEGAKLRVKGKGQPHPINSSAPNGDAIIIMHIMPDPNMVVTGSDIWLDLTIPFYDMLLGCEIEVKTPVNAVKLKVPKNSHEGKVLRIIGKGMPIYNTDQYGNLMVKLRTSTITLNEEQLEYVKKIKDLENV